ncbi:MAG: ABC transporter permease [Alphaproteobacteria bacterium]|nr:ABC transporter permease [Alphaproteobacteria bacterium]
MLTRTAWLGRLAPALLGLLVVAGWEALVRFNDIPSYVLPGPLAVAETLWREGPGLLAALLVTLRVTLAALLVAALTGVLLAALMAQSAWIERSLMPYAVFLQVTPIVAIAPLIIIYVEQPFLALLACAWIVAFFPLVANTAAGLRSADRGLQDLFRLYGAGRLQRLRLLLWPSALPHFLAGLRISGGLALIGAVVAEFVAGTGGSETGIAFRILEAGYRLQVPKMFAGLVLLAITGIGIYGALAWFSRLLLRRWHESALPPRS